MKTDKGEQRSHLHIFLSNDTKITPEGASTDNGGDYYLNGEV
jgi:hypothetical protein